MAKAQGDIDQFDRVRILRGASPGQALDFERDRARLGNWPRAVERVDVAPDHHPDDRLDIGLTHLSGADETTVAQHGVGVAETKHLFEPMGDENDRYALGFQRADDRGEIGDLGLAERRRRLVHHDQTRTHRQRARNFDQLLLGDREIAHQRHRIAPEANLLGDRLGLGGELLPADEQPRAWLAADEDVLGDRHVGRQREFLIDRHHAGALRVMRRDEAHLLAGEFNPPGVGGLRPRQDFQQRRFARAVLAEQRVNLAFRDFEVDPLEGANARELLADAGHLEDGRRSPAGVDALSKSVIRALGIRCRGARSGRSRAQAGIQRNTRALVSQAWIPLAPE